MVTASVDASKVQSLEDQAGLYLPSFCILRGDTTIVEMTQNPVRCPVVASRTWRQVGVKFFYLLSETYR